jgi:hypothetical protein
MDEKFKDGLKSYWLNVKKENYEEKGKYLRSFSSV